MSRKRVLILDDQTEEDLMIIFGFVLRFGGEYMASLVSDIALEMKESLNMEDL